MRNFVLFLGIVIGLCLLGADKNFFLYLGIIALVLRLMEVFRQNLFFTLLPFLIHIGILCDPLVLLAVNCITYLYCLYIVMKHATAR